RGCASRPKGTCRPSWWRASTPPSTTRSRSSPASATCRRTPRSRWKAASGSTTTPGAGSRRASSRSGSPRLQPGEQIQAAGAVAELLDLHAELVHQVEREVRQRRPLRIAQVLVALHLQIAPADDDHRDVVVVVRVAVAHAAAVEDDR